MGPDNLGTQWEASKGSRELSSMPLSGCRPGKRCSRVWSTSVGSKEGTCKSEAFSLLSHGRKHPYLLCTEVVLQGILQPSSPHLLCALLQVLQVGLDLWQRAALPSGCAQPHPSHAVLPARPGPGSSAANLSGRRELGEKESRRTRLAVVELLTGCKLTLSFFLCFFLPQQHLMMQMRKRSRRTTTATPTAMSAHLGTGAMFKERRWTEELKPSKTTQSAFKPHPMLQREELGSHHCPYSPGQAPCRETIPHTSSRDALHSQSRTVPLCSIAAPAGRRDVVGRRSGYTASESRSPTG